MIEIRDATVQEIPELVRVHVKADWDTYAPLFGAEAYMLDVTDSEGRWRQALRSGNVLLLAIRNSAIVGFGHCYEDRIGALYLLTPYHRQGIGGAILQKLLRALYGRGTPWHALMLWRRISRRLPSILHMAHAPLVGA